MPTLVEFANVYVASRSLSIAYANNLKSRAKRLQERTGKSDIADVLTDLNVNSFLRSITMSAYTNRSYREDFLSLWNAAADAGLLPYPATRRILCVRKPELAVECYSDDETRELLRFAATLPGRFRNGALRADYWQATIRLGWDSGLRCGDVLRFDRSSVRRDGTARVVQHKTQRAVTVRLWPSTVAALDKIGGKHPCAWPLDRSFFVRHFRKIVNGSGVGRGTFKWLRRASGSYVDLAQPGAGGKHLGHTSPLVFERHYDAKLGDRTLPMPPEL